MNSPPPELSAAAVRLAAGDLRPDGPPRGADDLVLMGTGEPDFATPEPIVRVGIAALHAGWTHYGDLNGDPELRGLAAALASETAGSEFDPSQVVVTSGATSAVSIAVAATVSPGDRVILLDPSYSLFASAVLAAGGEPVYVALDRSGHLDLDRLQAALSDARAIIVVNPANPVGTVFGRAELEALATLAERHHTWVIADEVCDHFVFDGRRFESCLAAEPEGGFFVMARYDLAMSSHEVARRLRGHGVVVRPGREFGPAGEHQLRLSIATAPAALALGLDRIDDWFAIARSPAVGRPR